jgi:hypothetical protein
LLSLRAVGEVAATEEAEVWQVPRQEKVEGRGRGWNGEDLDIDRPCQDREGEGLNQRKGRREDRNVGEVGDSKLGLEREEEEVAAMAWSCLSVSSPDH